MNKRYVKKKASLNAVILVLNEPHCTFLVRSGQPPIDSLTCVFDTIIIIRYSHELRVWARVARGALFKCIWPIQEAENVLVLMQ